MTLLLTALIATLAAGAGVLMQMTGGVQQPSPGPARSTPPAAKTLGSRHRATTPAAARVGRAADQPLGIPGHWKLVLNQTFTGGSLDTGVWRPGWFGTGVTGPINRNERDCYAASNLSMTGRSLDLAVVRKPSRCGPRHEPYTGAMISTNPRDGRATGGFQFRYGVVQAKVYLPAVGAQLADWPVVMTLGQRWPHDGENDILEGLGGVACFTFHNARGQRGGCARWLPAGWNVVASDWSPHSISYYYDGVRVGTVARGITTAPQYLVILNTVSRRYRAVTAADSMKVAYVRVWSEARTPSSRG